MKPDTVDHLRTQPMAANDLSIAYIGGGSRQWAPTLIQDLALAPYSGEVRLFDANLPAARKNARFGNWVQDTKETRGQWDYAAVEDIESALDGADIVVMSTQYDPRETFVHDLMIPKQFGIYGAVSATIGPGGIMRALRTIPVYREFADQVRTHCPNAWVFNFTNPVHFVTRALYDEFPDIKALGLCHEVSGTRSHLASIAERELGVSATREDIEVNVKGINHFTWIDEARYRGHDLWPILEDVADLKEARQQFSTEEMADESPFVDHWQVTWELFRRFGLLPAAGDRHLVEYANSFLQGGRAGLNRWGVKRTDSAYRAKHWTPAASDQTTDVEAWLAGDQDLELNSSRETFTEILAGLVGDDPYVTNVNLPNVGQVTGLESDTIVETNALVRTDSVSPLSAGSFPRPVRSMVGTHIDTIETVIDASRSGDLDRAFQGFLIDPQVRSLTPEDAATLFAELVDSQVDYLDDWDLTGSTVLSETE